MTSESTQSQSNGSNVPKEDAMTTSNTTPEASTGAPTDSANTKSDEVKRRVTLYDPSQIESDADKALQSATGITDATVQTDVAGVSAGVDLVRATSGDLAMAISNQEQAIKARSGALVAVAMAFAPVEGMLERVLSGGKAFLQRSRGYSSALTAINVALHLPAGDLGLPAALMTPLRSVVDQAQPAIDAARKAQVDRKQAAKEFMAAKKELTTAIALLKRSVERHRLSAGLPTRPPPKHKPSSGNPSKNPPDLNGAQQNGAAGGHATV